MVKISKPARSDLQQISKYIAHNSLYYAREVTQSIIQSIKQLEKFPYMGRIVPEFQDENIREILHDPYRIIYRVRDSIEVAAIIHAKRDFNDAIKNRIS